MVDTSEYTVFHDPGLCINCGNATSTILYFPLRKRSLIVSDEADDGKVNRQNKIIVKTNILFLI